MGWDAGSRRVVLQADLLWRPALVGGDEWSEPIWKLLERDVWVNAKSFVVKGVAKMDGDSAGAVRPLELVAEDVDEILLVLWGDEVLVPEDAVWLNG